ncbi:MAG: VWA domain-containing protein, partial [Thermoplasmata archaeon]
MLLLTTSTQIIPGSIQDSSSSDTEYSSESGTSNNKATKTRAASDFIKLGPDQTAFGRFGEIKIYQLTLLNNLTISDYFDITVASAPSNWAVTLFHIDNVTILVDSDEDNDGIPDTGLIEPLQSFEFIVKVTVPHTQAFNEPEITLVTAQSSLSAVPHQISCRLVTKAYPYLDATKSVSPVTVYEEAAEELGLPTRARVMINIKGGGIPNPVEQYSDTVFLIDNTGSMLNNDPTKIRISAAKSYVNNMTEPALGAVVTFYGTMIYPRGYAWLARGPTYAEEHLSSNYQRINENIDYVGLDSNIGGGTNILRALQVGNNELINYGDPEHLWYEILLTDGYDSGNAIPGDRDAAIRNEAQRAASNNIVIFTIGLGNATNAPLLRNIASTTGGEYFSAENASQLMDIYNEIHFKVNSVAGQDPDPTDENSMVRDVLPDYINVVHGSFRVEPGSIPTSPVPARIEENPTNTSMHWDIAEILINQSWLVSFEVTSSKVGWVPVGVYPDSRILYTNWNFERIYAFSLPEVWIEVLPIPRPDVLPTDVKVNNIPYETLDNFQVLRGESVKISAKVQNIGNAATFEYSDVFVIGFFIETNPSSPFYSTGVEGLSIDAISSEIQVTWNAPYTLDIYEISIFADWQDHLPEGIDGEKNNIYNLNINVTHRPEIDLIPIELQIDEQYVIDPLLNVVEVEVESEVKIDLKVKNKGNENTNYYTPEFNVVLIDRKTPEEPLELDKIGAISANKSSEKITFYWKAPIYPGSVNLEIEVDSTNLIPEGPKGELNN